MNSNPPNASSTDADEEQHAERHRDPVAGQHVQLEEDQQHADEREREDQPVRKAGVDVRSEEQRERTGADRARDAVQRLQLDEQPEKSERRAKCR